MKTIAFFVTFVFVGHVFGQITTPPPGPVEPLSLPVINPENGHAYVLLTQGNWTDSEAEAVKLGGHLATIRNQAEEDFVSSFFIFYGGQKHSLWIGLREAGKSSRFVWAAGGRVAYTDWFGGQVTNPTDGRFPYVAIMEPFPGVGPHWFNWDDQIFDYSFNPMNGVVEIENKR